MARDRTDAPTRNDVWEQAFQSSGLPMFCPAGRTRPRVAFAAPLADGVSAEHELADVILTELEPAWRVREAAATVLPADWRLIDLFDVWLGEPALAGQVVAADYRISLGAGGPVARDALERAAGALLAATSLPRERLKGGSTIGYDLRPLLADVSVIDPGPPLQVRMRTRFHPELGTGRPAEVVAALAEAAGMDLVAGAVVRERLILAGDEEPTR